MHKFLLNISFFRHWLQAYDAIYKHLILVGQLIVELFFPVILSVDILSGVILSGVILSGVILSGVFSPNTH